jgi:hypothetical protein
MLLLQFKYHGEEAIYITTSAFINLIIEICFEYRNRDGIIKLREQTYIHTVCCSILSWNISDLAKYFLGSL